MPKYKTYETQTFKKNSFDVVESIKVEKGHNFITIKKNWWYSKARSGYDSIDLGNKAAISLRDQLNRLFPIAGQSDQI